jgi:hypothetical protein
MRHKYAVIKKDEGGYWVFFSDITPRPNSSTHAFRSFFSDKEYKDPKAEAIKNAFKWTKPKQGEVREYDRGFYKKIIKGL